MTNKYLLTVDSDPVVICNTIEQAVTYIMCDPHLNKDFKDWYEEERHAYGAIEYQEYIKHSIQNGDIVRLETVPVLDNNTPPKEKKKYLIHNKDGDCFLGVTLTEDQAKLLFWLNDKNIICSDFMIDKVTTFSFEEF